MNKIFTILGLLVSFSAYSQNGTFNNNAGDNLWSNAGNWANGEFPTAIAYIKDDVIVDTMITIETIEIPAGYNMDVVISGSDTLILTAGNVNNGNAIRNQSDTTVTMFFTGNVTIHNTEGASNLSSKEVIGNNVQFSEGSFLNLLSVVKNKNFGSVGSTIFNGRIGGTGTLNCIGGNNSKPIFGSTADNSAFEGKISLFESTMVSNTTVPNGFLPIGGQLQIGVGGAFVEINGENTMSGRINKTGGGPCTVDFNSNQNSMGTISIASNDLVLDVDPSVTSLQFASSSNIVWNENSTLTITNFENGIIRFGDTDTTLTSQQLSQIDIGGAMAGLDEDGFLRNDVEVGLSELAPVAGLTITPNPVIDGHVEVSYDQLIQTGKVSTYNVLGHLVNQRMINNESRLSIDISSEPSGLYFVTIEDTTEGKYSTIKVTKN